MRARSPRPGSPRRLAALAVAIGAAGALTVLGPAPASAIPSPCSQGPGQDYCVNASHPGGSGPTKPVAAGPGGSKQSSPPPACGWETVAASIAEPWITAGAVINGAPPAGAAVTWQAYCISQSTAGATYGGPYRWVAAAPVITPADIAQGLYESMKGRMPDPVVVTNPPRGTASVIGVPVFVFVSNWQPALSASQDLAGVLVTVRARPQLLFNPGESGSGARSCNGPGRRYDPAGGDLWEQASAPGACTHVYRHRTGAEGRPAAWPGTVTVRWSINWSASDGSGGSFPVVNRTTAVPRAVEEVQTVVVSGG